MTAAARVAVGAVLLVAGAAKLRQPAWPATAAAFGAPARLVPVLPWMELVLGALLVAGVGLPWTAAAATVLLAAFTVVVAARVRAGDAVPCGCFGETSPEPVGWATVARNTALVALSGAATAAGSGPAAPAAVAVGLGAAAALVVGDRLRTAARR